MQAAGRGSAKEIRSPQMSTKSAKEQAGYYALCQQSGSGLLMPVGRLYARPEGAQEEARQQGGSPRPQRQAACHWHLLSVGTPLATRAVACVPAGGTRSAVRGKREQRKRERWENRRLAGDNVK